MNFKYYFGCITWILCLNYVPPEERECARFVGVSDFIDQQIKNALEKYTEWKEQTEENGKTS